MKYAPVETGLRIMMVRFQWYISFALCVRSNVNKKNIQYHYLSFHLKYKLEVTNPAPFHLFYVSDLAYIYINSIDM